MWHSLRLLVTADAGFIGSTSELLASTARYLILAVGGLYVVWFCAATTWWWPQEAGWKVWEVSPLFVATCFLALWLLSKNLLLSQAVWQVGLAALITLSIYVFHTPEIAFAYVLLPFMAVVTVNWLAGLIVEAGIALLAGSLSQGSDVQLIPGGYALAIVAGGAITLALGWASIQALFTVIHWCLFSLEEARKNLEETRQHRAQLYRMEKSLQEAYYRLERVNAALVVAWKAAEDAERLKAQFVTNVSHELRTPLNLIVGFSELMMTSPESYDGVTLPGPYRSDMNALHDSAQHLLALADDVLDLTRVEVGKISLVREESEMAPLVAEATNMLQDYISAKGLELRVSISRDLPKLWLDRLRIRQVLLNLLVNAARFTEQGWISVDVARQADEVVVRVTDTGSGIPTADLGRIFEEYRTTGQTSPTWHSGSGLGLPLSKKFVELHHGHMGVESTENSGTSFWFTLPCVLPARADPKAVQRRAAEAVAQMGSAQPVVVVAHDDPGTVALLRRYLEGYQVVNANDSASVLLLAAQNRAIAIVTGGGVALSSQLPEDVLVITCPLPSGRQMAAALGADALLVKPVSIQELQAALERLDRPFRKVLIADDDPDSVRLLQRMMRAYANTRADGEIQFLEAYTGEEALSLIRTEQPELILLDLIMPGLTGYTVLQQIAADPTTTDIPVLVVSAHAQDYTSLRLTGPIQILRGEGFRMGETVRLLEAVFKVLAPGWHHPDSMGPEHPLTPAESQAWADTQPLPTPVPAAAR